jgi:hypothetical protein
MTSTKSNLSRIDDAFQKRTLSELNNSNLEVRHHAAQAAKYVLVFSNFRACRRPFTIGKGGTSNFETRNPRIKVLSPRPPLLVKYFAPKCFSSCRPPSYRSPPYGSYRTLRAKNAEQKTHRKSLVPKNATLASTTTTSSLWKPL